MLFVLLLLPLTHDVPSRTTGKDAAILLSQQPAHPASTASSSVSSPPPSIAVVSGSSSCSVSAGGGGTATGARRIRPAIVTALSPSIALTALRKSSLGRTPHRSLA